MRRFMEAAFGEAKTAMYENEVPVGAAIFKSGMLIASAHNKTEQNKDATAHAELEVIRAASRILHSARLIGCELYVTLEPCPMCAGAIVHSRISKLVYGASSYDFGAFGGYMNLKNHSYAGGLEVYGGIMEEECGRLLKEFFEEKRA